MIIYCPDRHISYGGRTHLEHGVGGGVTSRLRMARALARAGHAVTMVVNCQAREIIDGVSYVPLGEVRRLEADVLVFNTSGGQLDLTPALELECQAQLRILWVSGIAKPHGLNLLDFDVLYPKSNFLRRVTCHDWGVDQRKTFVVYNVFEEALFAEAERTSVSRDTFRLVYFSHPAKGLEPALRVLRTLREVDERFHLVVFGGPGLWGAEGSLLLNEPGATYAGMVGQAKLAAELFRCSYSVNLQSSSDGFGMVITESMRAGCIVFASPIGAYPELVRQGVDGFLVPGDSLEKAAERCAAMILQLTRNPDYQVYLRRNAQTVPWDSDTIASAWTGHWDWWLSGGRRDDTELVGACPRCRGRRLCLADGIHCIACGWYERGCSFRLQWQAAEDS